MKMKPGDVVTNEQIVEQFKCSPQGGMRRSHRTNTLVLVTKHTEDNIYADRWHDGILDYVGMGQSGNQSFNFMQNWTLYNSRSNGVELHLFEVFESGFYTYVGRVVLDGEPRMEQHGDRSVCVFPLRVIEG